MPEPTPSQKKAMWVYIVILMLAILGIWSYFIRAEFKQISKKSEEQGPGLGGILSEFKDSVKEGAYLFEEIKQSFKQIEGTKATATKEEAEGLTGGQKEQLIDKVMERLDEDD